MIDKTSIRELKGIGDKTQKLFEKVGVSTVGDLIRYYPRGYDIYEDPVPVSEAEEGRTQTISGAIYGRVQVSGSTKMQVTTMYVKDLTGTMKVIWFRMPFLRSTFAKGGAVTLRGRIVRKRDGLVMEHPEIFYPCDKYADRLNTLQPLYGLTSGLTNNAVAKAVRQALDGMDLASDLLPSRIRLRYGLAEYNYAVRGIHFPEDKEVFYHARDRLVFEEFLAFILSIRKLKDKNEKLANEYVIGMKPETEAFLQGLPFRLTEAQKKVWNEIAKDMAGETAMSRLVQGDVGSGKTIVAVLALMNTAQNGYQGAMMAPTEVLARQHYESITRLFDTYGIKIKVELLTGSMTAKEKRRAYDRIECGYARIIVGTHALIQGGVNYDCLALVVTDEQHRFGVKQREAFAKKGSVPHVLVMSATPIPRTLAIILYGDLDISVIDELPANRLPIKNCVVDTGYRKTAYSFMKKQVAQGRQCYVICPMVEESESMEAENVIDYASMLQEELGEEIAVSYLHGKMRQTEKDDIMERFGKNEIQVLVSTTVIEVGIDVPNATVMVIESAERFGLSQLHQLRGRVGRGGEQSYCILMSGDKLSKEARARLDAMCQTNDGFRLAELDLKLRGAGDMHGTQQSGETFDLKIADLAADTQIMQITRDEAVAVLSADIDLSQPEHAGLRRLRERYRSHDKMDFSQIS